MPRERKATKFFRNGRWHVKLTVDLRGGGTDRRTVKLPASITEDQVELAEAKRVSIAAKAKGRLFDPREPVEVPGAEIAFWDYVERWAAARRARGLRSVRKDVQRLRDHVGPALGVQVGPGRTVTVKGKSMASITPDDIRAVVRAIDKKIHDPAVDFGWKTGAKTWGAVTKLFGDAVRSKDPELRVLRSNLCQGVEGPDRGHEKAAQWLYPREFAALVACEDVPLRWRRIYAVATYLYLRLSEARALHWEDLDMVAGMARIHRSTDERGRYVREHTKTMSVRHFRIEPALLELLEFMALEGRATGRLFDSIDDAAGELRDHLWRAGVRRDALHKSTETSMAIRFHDLRATGITWAALRGDSTIEIRDRAGHTELEQTNDYMRRASSAGDVGTPFPALDSLFSSVPGIVPEVTLDLESSVIDADSVVRRGGLEPPWELPR